MQRNMDVIRALLLELDAQPNEDLIGAAELAKKLVISAEVCTYHLKLLYQAGFIEAEAMLHVAQLPKFLTPKKGEGRIQSIAPSSLTWEGHEFLETVRDEEIWKKSKIGAKKIGSLSVDIIKDIAAGYLKKRFKALTDLELDI